MAIEDPQLENTGPDLEDALGDDGINERFPLMDNSLGRSESLLFFRNLHQGYESQTANAKRLVQLLQNENKIIQQKLNAQNQLEMSRLQEELNRNNQFIQYLLELQNLFVNDEKFSEWLDLQLRSNNVLAPVVAKENQNVLENKAREARLFPYASPTPFHYTPFPTTPFR